MASFEQFLREVRKGDRGIKQFEDPVHIEYSQPAGKFLIGVEIPMCPLPEKDEMIEVRLFGGQAYMVVNRAEWGSMPETANMMFIHGRRLKV